MIVVYSLCVKHVTTSIVRTICNQLQALVESPTTLYIFVVADRPVRPRRKVEIELPHISVVRGNYHRISPRCTKIARAIHPVQTS